MDGATGGYWKRRLLGAVVVCAGAAAMLVAVPARASHGANVRCIGTADACGATVMTNGVASRRVTIALTGTNLGLVGVRAIPASARRAFSISRASFARGGSEFRFTLRRAHPAPRRARIVLLFGAGSAAGSPTRHGKLPGVLRQATATLLVGSGMTVSIVGGGSGTSNCTDDETNTTFTTSRAREDHPFGFDSRASGWSCLREPSFSEFKVAVRDPTGKIVASGVMSLLQDFPYTSYYVECFPMTLLTPENQWKGASCSVDGSPYDKHVTIERVF